MALALTGLASDPAASRGKRAAGVQHRSGLSQVLFFNPWRNGDPLLAAVDAFAGGSEVQASISTYEVPCYNCHDNAAWAVLFYPDSGKVLVFKGNHGCDSCGARPLSARVSN
ncbi:hypothetical protein [Myxococcus sp. AB036A]|uniref:hypothetical protein n=1 Tax=Myxococcus sp. AB036A TaxID=2562793 RepID=UPI0011471D07|nr:hypothetical protein [Myxococcus sp. AB036A]